MRGVRFCAFLLILFLTLTGCSFGSGAGAIIRYDIPSGVNNLDPQFAEAETARMIISNTFEGLFRQLPSGEVVCAVAQGYDVSDDKLTYTIRLRTDARWSTNSTWKESVPVTAHDFVFALQRLFNPNAPSPFAANLISIRNARQILSGSMEETSLGVRAADDYTLIITLERPDSLLPELLSASYAMPCNEAFFRSTRARYGLEQTSLLFNGPFYVRGWNNDRAISLRSNPHYVSDSPVIAAGVDLYVPIVNTASSSESSLLSAPTDPSDRFLSGATDACKIDFELLDAVEQEGGTYVSFEDTIWVLAMNTENEYLANIDIRKAISYSVNRSLFGQYLPENLSPTATLIPPAVMVAGHSYREFAGRQSPVSYSPDLVERSLTDGLAALGAEELALHEILVCDDSNQALLAGFIQKNLSADLYTSTGLIKLSRDEIWKRVTAGDYELAIFPLTAAYSSPDAIFSYFKADASVNFTGYQNERLDAMLESTSHLSGEAQMDVYRQAEQLLLADCPVVPLYFGTTYYAMADGVSDIDFSPFLSGMSFRNARKK